MNKTTNHTPLPWHIEKSGDGRYAIEDASGTIRIALMCDSDSDAEELADAALIVRAVNSHQALVSVLQRIAAEVNALDMSPVLWDDMHAALALAQGEQKEQVQA
jgi:hypothetical protein